MDDGRGLINEINAGNPGRLADAHWDYVAGLLRMHGEDDEVVEKCGYHYRTAFVHGWKHAKEDAT